MSENQARSRSPWSNRRSIRSGDGERVLASNGGRRMPGAGTDPRDPVGLHRASRPSCVTPSLRRRAGPRGSAVPRTSRRTRHGTRGSARSAAPPAAAAATGLLPAGAPLVEPAPVHPGRSVSGRAVGGAPRRVPAGSVRSPRRDPHRPSVRAGASLAGPTPTGRPASGWLRSNAGRSLRMRGMLVKLCRGGGQEVAHSREAPYPQGSFTVTRGALRAVTHTFSRNGSIDMPEDHRPDGGDLVAPGELVLVGVVRVPAGHPVHPEPVLDQERHVEPDEQQPEMHHPEAFVQHPPGELRPPEIEPGEHREHHRAEHHVMEVRDHEIRVRDMEIKRRRRQDHPGQTRRTRTRSETPTRTASASRTSPTPATWCRSS